MRSRGTVRPAGPLAHCGTKRRPPIPEAEAGPGGPAGGPCAAAGGVTITATGRSVGVPRRSLAAAAISGTAEVAWGVNLKSTGTGTGSYHSMGRR